MGIFDSLKSEAQRNFIARADEAKNQIVYKYPERNIRIMTQLTVQADEVALFVKDGVVAGKLGPGRHNLDTNKIPFLSALLEKATQAVSNQYLRARADSTTAALEALANHLAGIRGRKNLIWVSSGFPLVIHDPLTGPQAQTRSATRFAVRSKPPASA